MAKQKGGNKLRRSGKDANYYKFQRDRTLANKTRRAGRVKRRADYWGSSVGIQRKTEKMEGKVSARAQRRKHKQGKRN